ncbi:MAG: response regulator [Dehalococcoidia bacterium]
MLRDVTRDGHPGSALHIVIVERERLLRAGLERLLGGSPGMVVTGSVESIAAAEHLPAPTEADIVLAGADVPDMLGTEGVERLLTRFQNAQVVILGPEAEPGLVIAALRAGADGYLTRNIPPRGWCGRCTASNGARWRCRAR